ncbi:hypothetical protein [Acuticoccus kandeliae]|uniref:hypothetical protein n=1 Tax=Acuticoccus kandeliae TaxID=2073160 RepID=UPI000D3ECFFC|nr:hypothetical protein [Acuticoccus kandeliae]
MPAWPASPAPPSEQAIAEARRDAENLLATVLADYRRRYRPQLEKMHARDQEKTRRAIAQCAGREARGFFADPNIAAAEKLAAVDEATAALGQMIKDPDKADGIINVCVGVTVAAGLDWSGIIWASLLNARSGGERGGGLLAAYYGSGALGASDMAKAKAALASAGEVGAHPKIPAILAALDVLDGTAYAHALYDAALEDQSIRAENALAANAERRDALRAQFAALCPTWSAEQRANPPRAGTSPREAAEAEAQDILAYRVKKALKDAGSGASLAECFQSALDADAHRTALAYAMAAAYFEGADPTQNWPLEIAILLGSGKGLEARDLGAAAVQLDTIASTAAGHAEAETLLKATRAAIDAGGG